jgi:helix-turn-helix, Psq domain/Tc5 transposase DNA-binding domain
MTRPKNPKAAAKEARLQEAITSVLNGEHTCHSAAIAFNVPRRTLYDRVNGNKKRHNQAHEHDQNLAHAEEKELVRWITVLTISGYPPHYETLRRLAEIIRERRVKKADSNDAEVPVIIYDKIGKDWVARFLRRQPELAGVRP